MEYLSHPLVIGIGVGSVSVLASYVDNKYNNKNRTNNDYIKLFVVTVSVSSVLSYVYNNYLNGETDDTIVLSCDARELDGDSGETGETRFKKNQLKKKIRYINRKKMMRHRTDTSNVIPLVQVDDVINDTVQSGGVESFADSAVVNTPINTMVEMPVNAMVDTDNNIGEDVINVIEDVIDTGLPDF